MSACVTGYRSCTTQMQCSERCVRAYMDRYARRCTRGRTPTCQDYARIHNGGPQGCRRSATLGHWGRVQKCCSDRNCNINDSSGSHGHHVTTRRPEPSSSHAIRYHTESTSFCLVLLSSLIWLL